MFGQLDDDPKAGTHDLDPMAGDLPGDADDDRDDRDPGDVADADEGADEGDESPEQEVARLRKQNRELLNMKSNYESLKKTVEERFSDLDDRFERGGRRREEYDEDRDDPVRANPRLVELVQGLRESSPELAELLGHVIQGVEEKSAQLEQRMRDLRDEARTRIPPRYEKAVARLMRTGEFGSRRAALMAVYGAEYQQLRRQRSNGRDDDDGGREPRRAERREPRGEEPPQPRSITKRGMSPARRAERGVVTQAEHERRLNEGSLEERREYLQKYRSGAIKVARKG